jgi:cation diffusion facilitator family transporter
MHPVSEQEEGSMACHDCDAPVFDGQSRAYRRALIAVLVINLSMFLVEVFGGFLSGSRALWADALDFAADSATYGASLWAINQSMRTRSTVALVKAASLAVMGIVVMVMAAERALSPAPPVAELMGGIALAALAANLTSVVLLMRYRDGDANVRSVWLCSRNDAIGNLAVLAAAGLVAVTQSAWPDIAVAAAMALLFLSSALSILRQALREWRQEHPESV